MLTPSAYALLGLTAIVGVLVAALTFAMLRFFAAARDAKRVRGNSGEVALLSAALQEAVGRLKAQERATAARAEASDARAEASERLGAEIIASLSAGLLPELASGRLPGHLSRRTRRSICRPS